MRQPQLPRFRHQLQALAKPFPLLAGSLVKQYVICGKPRCRCERGEKHGPLYYLYWKEQGRSRSLYVPRAKVAELRRQIQNYRHLQKELARLVRRQLREWRRHLQEERR
ncbi:MAG: hypothetical protein LAN62_06660 [Acidobacteriia bacterium]|nr:hypothetical protein [Terriglobia bacterium]